MQSVLSPRWQEKASDFFSTSGWFSFSFGSLEGSDVCSFPSHCQVALSAVSTWWLLVHNGATSPLYQGLSSLYLNALFSLSFSFRSCEYNQGLNLGVKLKEAGQSAGVLVGEAAKDAKVNVADAAERVGSVVKSKWSIFQQPSTKHAMQERLLSAAASTGFFLRKGFSGTKDRVAVGKTKVEEVAKKTVQRSKTLLSDIERWQKGVASSDVFGVPIEVTVQRQQSNWLIPLILVRCADYLISSGGLNSQCLFKSEGDKKVLQQLVSLYNQEPDVLIPEGTNPLDVAALIKCYLASLPEPLTTIKLYNDIRGARSNIRVMKNILKKLPHVNYVTLEFITALLLRVSQKSLLNKMDVQSLSEELAPVIMWKDQRPEIYRQYWHHQSRSLSKRDAESLPAMSAWDMLEANEDDVSTPISLDDGFPVDFGAIEVVHCLIEHHNAIFTDANETIWR